MFVLSINVAETADAIESEAIDGLSVTLTATKVEGVPARWIARRDENRGDTVSAADGLVVVSSDGARFIGDVDDASEFPFILVSLS